MDCLNEIAHSKEAKFLVSLGFNANFDDDEKQRIRLIYNYNINNYKKKIELKEIAEVAQISPNPFCRYFKSKSMKTYSQFVNEIRVGQACKLLIEDKLSVKEICYECGFFNFTSFHRYFRRVVGKSPLNYQKEYI